MNNITGSHQGILQSKELQNAVVSSIKVLDILTRVTHSQTIEVSPQELVDAVASLTKTATKDITNEIDSIDFKKEAQELK
jgi:hypothetical protein